MDIVLEFYNSLYWDFMFYPLVFLVMLIPGGFLIPLIVFAISSFMILSDMMDHKVFVSLVSSIMILLTILNNLVVWKVICTLILFIFMVKYFLFVDTDHDEYTLIENTVTGILSFLISFIIKYHSINILEIIILSLGTILYIKIVNEKYKFLMKARYIEIHETIVTKLNNGWLIGLICVFVCLLH